jgi:hypothetical protein
MCQSMGRRKITLSCLYMWLLTAAMASCHCSKQLSACYLNWMTGYFRRMISLFETIIRRKNTASKHTYYWTDASDSSVGATNDLSVFKLRGHRDRRGGGGGVSVNLVTNLRIFISRGTLSLLTYQEGLF